ncbi:MAG: hypothetical protein WC393_00890 [Candidatus Nanoarchaeia archaeon]|jgi:hypothetical protein
MEKEEILKKLKEKNEIKQIVPGDYIGFFKRIGDNKSVTKIMDFKPDYFIDYFDNSKDCLFFVENAFIAFSFLSKLAVLKMLNCEFDFKKIIFYSKDSKLMESEEKGIISEKKIVTNLDAMDYIKELIEYFEQKTGKKIVLNIE